LSEAGTGEYLDFQQFFFLLLVLYAHISHFLIRSPGEIHPITMHEKARNVAQGHMFWARLGALGTEEQEIGLLEVRCIF
jgi:hypothetical protein